MTITTRTNFNSVVKVLLNQFVVITDIAPVWATIYDSISDSSIADIINGSDFSKRWTTPLSRPPCKIPIIQNGEINNIVNPTNFRFFSQSISVSSTSALQSRQSNVNKHILLVLVDIFNSHMILHLLFRFSIEGDTKMCVTDYCPHSYSYRMIASHYNFFFMSLVSAFGMLYLYLLLNLSASLIPSRERK